MITIPIHNTLFKYIEIIQVCKQICLEYVYTEEGKVIR